MAIDISRFDAMPLSYFSVIWIGSLRAEPCSSSNALLLKRGLTKALRDAGAVAEMVSVPQGKHGFPKEKVDELYDTQIWPFLKKTGILR